MSIYMTLAVCHASKVKDAELLKNQVVPAFRCVTVEDNITRQFLKFKEVCISEIECTSSCVEGS